MKLLSAEEEYSTDVSSLSGQSYTWFTMSFGQMSLWIVWLLIKAIDCLFQMTAVLFAGAVEFREAPSGTVYIPPNSFPAKRVLCVTNEKANITWAYEDSGDELKPSEYPIVVLNDTASAMDVSEQVASTLPGAFTRRQVHCLAGSVSSSSFLFQYGGKHQRFIFINSSWISSSSDCRDT